VIGKGDESRKPVRGCGCIRWVKGKHPTSIDKYLLTDINTRRSIP
jgi:hypothetical protein